MTVTNEKRRSQALVRYQHPDGGYSMFECHLPYVIRNGTPEVEVAPGYFIPAEWGKFNDSLEYIRLTMDSFTAYKLLWSQWQEKLDNFLAFD